jgi:hypothetical protein
MAPHRNPSTHAHRKHRLAADAAMTAIRVLLAIVGSLLRLTLLAALILIEPLVGWLLVPFAFGCFAVTVVFGFLLQMPNFPKWGLLALSVGSLVPYLLLGALTGLVAGSDTRRA